MTADPSQRTKTATDTTPRKTASGVEIHQSTVARASEIFTPEAIAFVAGLQREFNPTREVLLAKRAERQATFEAGTLPDFLPSTRSIREGSWRVAPVPSDLRDRRVEITGPVERKMMINALNSGASTFMADFEDANSPTWENVVAGQVNLIDAVRRTITFSSPDGRTYRLGEKTATLIVRPRGWHLPDTHVRVDGRPISGSLLDFGLYAFHNARALLDRGTGPYFYLPKLQSHLEARLWNDVFTYAEDALAIPRGSMKATVLVEHVLAALEMDEILYELKDRSSGLNAGRWDYMFSIIKTFRTRSEFVLPDRAQVTMTVPFMRAYTELLVRTCHRRGAYAIGGMAAFIPSRRDPEVNRIALDQVRKDKVREVTDGFEGTWVAHPDLVTEAMTAFTEGLDGRLDQLERTRDDVRVTSRELLDVRVPGGTVTEAGVRTNVRVGIQYIESWLRGTGAAALYNLMEDAATAEISRSQIWQWVRHGTALKEGPRVTRELVRRVADEELDRLRREAGGAFEKGKFADARRLFELVALSDSFIEFLTIPAYGALS